MTAGIKPDLTGLAPMIEIQARYEDIMDILDALGQNASFILGDEGEDLEETSCDVMVHLVPLDDGMGRGADFTAVAILALQEERGRIWPGQNDPNSRQPHYRIFEIVENDEPRALYFKAVS